MRATISASLLLSLLTAIGCSSSEPTGSQPGNNLTPCPSGSSPTTVSLALGSVKVVGSPSTASCIALSGSGGSAATFVVVAANADSFPDVSESYAFATSSTAPSTQWVGSPRGPMALAATHRALLRIEGALGGSSTAEGRFRAMERRVLHLGTSQSLARANTLVRASRVRAQSITPDVVPSVGDTLSLKVPNANAANACQTYATVKAVVKAVGTHGILVQDAASPSGGFADSDYTSMSSEFDTYIYPTDTLHFGQPTDIDGNGHIILLFTPQVNAATPKGSSNILEGFFFGGDLFPVAQCAESNEGELFYLLVPDPNGQFSDKRATADVRQDIRGTIAHEFQHMINLGVRLNEPDATDEATWLNEGLSHFAEELVGRAEEGYSDTQKLAIANIADYPSLDNFYAFFGQNIGRLYEWLIDPGTLGPTSAQADTSLAVRGAAWSLLRWTADHYANGNVAAFTRGLVAGPDSSVVNLTTHAGAPLDSLLAGWLTAIATSDAGVPGLDSRYTFTSFDIRDVESALVVANGQYPLALNDLSADTSVVTTVSSAAGTYYVVATPSAAAGGVGLLGSDGTVLSFPPARLYIVRVE